MLRIFEGMCVSLLYIIGAACLVDQGSTVIRVTKEKIYNISKTSRFFVIARKILRPSSIYKAKLNHNHE